MRSLERIVALLPWCSSVCLPVCQSWTGVHCDYTMHFSADFSLWLDNPMFWAPGHQIMSTYSQPSFSSSTWKRGGLWMCKLGVIFHKKLCYCRGTMRAQCQLKSCKILHKCSTDCMWKRLQPMNDLQCHSRSLLLSPFDRPYTISY